MPHIGMRISKALTKEIGEIALKNNLTKSDILRASLENYVIDHYISDTDVSWKPLAWQLFGLDIIKINHALAHAKTTEEFFSYIDHWTKLFKITTFPPQIDIVKLRITNSTGFDKIIEIPRNGSRELIIKTIVEKINDALIEYAMDFHD